MKTIFISSTFRDMQQERDVLAMDVLPEIAAAAEKYGENVSFVDLRWGVDTSELESAEGARKVLSVCLDEIERSHPYMIIILGERYGWVPEREMLVNAAGSKGHAIEDDFKSVTALEIEYGALSASGQLDRCLFYMREPLPLDQMSPEARALYQPESDEHRQKLLDLKEKITAKTGNPIKTYSVNWDAVKQCPTGLTAFADMVLSDLKALLADEWEESASLSPQEREIKDVWHIFDSKSARFAAMQAMCADYQQEILAETTRLFVLKGKEGCGKSFFMAKIAADLRAQGLQVMPFICGNSEYSLSAYAFIQQAVYFLETSLGIKTPSDVGINQDRSYFELRDRLSLLIEKYDRENSETLIFIIDGLEYLQGENALRFDWLPDILPGSVRFVCSCLDNADLKLPILFSANTVVRQVMPIPEAERVRLINEMTAASHKQLHASVIEKLASLPQADDPLYLSMLIDRMLLFNSDDFGEIARRGNDMAAINQYLGEIIDTAPRDVNGLCIAVISEAGSRISKPLTDHTLRFLSLSRYGLREQDIKALLEAEGTGFNALGFSRLIKYMRSYLIRRPDGRIDFAHQNIRSGIIQAMGRQTYKADSLLYMSYLKTLPVSDPLRSDDMILHAWRCGDEEALVRQVADLDEKTMPGPFLSAAEQIKIIAGSSPEWICCAVEDYGDTPEGKKFINKLSFTICNHFGDSWKEQHALEIILEPLCRQFKKQYQASQAELVQLVQLQHKLAVAYKTQGSYDAARELYEWGTAELIKIPQKSLLEKTWLASCWRKLAVIYKNLGNYQAMQANIQQAVTLQEDIVKESDQLNDLKNLAAAYELLANVENYTGQLEGQLLHSLQSAEIRRLVLEKENSADNRRKLASSYAFAVMSLSAQNRLEEAAGYSQKVLEIREPLARELRTPVMLQELALAYNDLAAVYMELSRFEEAGKALEAAGPIFEKLLESQDTARAKIDLANYYHNYCHYYSDQQKYAPALEWMQKAAGLRREVYEELKTAAAREKYEATLVYIENLEKNLTDSSSGTKAPEITPAQKLMHQAAVAINDGQQIMNSDPATARQKFELGIQLAQKAIELDSGHRNRNFLAYGYYILATLLKDEPKYQAQCWKKCSDIWIELYEKAPDKETRNLYKETYDNAKKLLKMARKMGVK